MEREYQKRNAPKMPINELVHKGFIEYRSGNMQSAYEHLGKAIYSPVFKASDYPYFDVMGFYEAARSNVIGEGRSK